MEITVATINLRNSQDRWRQRRHVLVGELLNTTPDLISLQEISFPIGQGRWIRNQLNARLPEGKRALRRHLPGVRTLYWLVDYARLGPEERRALRRDTVRSGAGAVSIDHRRIDADFLRDFGHLRIHAFTVDRPERVAELVEQGVAVILTDVDLVARFPALGAAPPPARDAP